MHICIGGNARIGYIYECECIRIGYIYVKVMKKSGLWVTSSTYQEQI